MTDAAAAQTIEFSGKAPCNRVGHKVSGETGFGARGNEAGLHAANGERKYVNRAERARILAALEKLNPDQSLFGLLLAWTGARVSEILALGADSFQVEASVVTIVTLKRRKTSIREVPIPPALMARLERRYSLRRTQRSGNAFGRLWPWCRVTGWRIIRRACALAHVTGRRACPRGLRHGFGVGALLTSVPITVIQRLMGHAKLATTSIYMAVAGPDVALLLKPFWSGAVHEPPACRM